MVSETTNILFVGIISGWLVAITKPVCDRLASFLDKNGCPVILIKPLIYIIWLILLMVFILKIYG